MVTLLTDNWAGAGAAPTFGHLVDFPADLPPSQEQVMIRLPIHEDVTPINDTYSNFKFTMQIRVKSNVSDDRLKVLADETIRIINTYAITGITRQFAKRGENTSDRKKQVFAYDVWAILEEHMSTAGTSYSSPGAGDVTFPADVTVTDDLITDNIISADPINIRPGGNLVDYLEFDTVGNHPVITVVGGGTLQIRGDSGPIRLQPSGDYTDSIEFSTTANVPKIAAIGASDLELGTDTNTVGVDQIAALLMFGSANAVFHNCAYMDSNVDNSFVANSARMDSTGAGTRYPFYQLMIPCATGSLGLNLASFRLILEDADVANYVDEIWVLGIKTNATYDTLLNDGTNRTTNDTFDYPINPDADCSTYVYIQIQIKTESAGAGLLGIMAVALECYYA